MPGFINLGRKDSAGSVFSEVLGETLEKLFGSIFVMLILLL